jgi:hypothetical protein
MAAGNNNNSESTRPLNFGYYIQKLGKMCFHMQVGTVTVSTYSMYNNGMSVTDVATLVIILNAQVNVICHVTTVVTSNSTTKKKKVVGLERGPLSLVSTTEELLDRKVAAPV